MPVLTRSQKRPADEAPEIDDPRKGKKPGSGAHNIGQASVKKKEKKAHQKATERKRAPPEKQAAVHAKDAAQHQARRAEMPDEENWRRLPTMPRMSIPGLGVPRYAATDKSYLSYLT